MRISVVLLIALAFVPVSCTLKQFERAYKSTISVDEALVQKEALDSSDNPARKYEITSDLSGKMISVKDIVVKDIVPASDIDYQFCVLSEMQTPKGVVEFYIYSRDVSVIAKLEKGKSRIQVLGDFRRFFTLLDATFVKIDIGDADITIIQ
ncbi:MAG TPA: hypothetical protein VF857_09530 [Spirochaetota bacterium]